MWELQFRPWNQECRVLQGYIHLYGGTQQSWTLNLIPHECLYKGTGGQLNAGSVDLQITDIPQIS